MYQETSLSDTIGILRDGQVRMANLAIVAGYSVNGVARLHTEILKKRELKDFYEMMPEKFKIRLMVLPRDVSCFTAIRY